MVTTKATFQGEQFENVSRNLEFFILTTTIDISEDTGPQNLNKFLQAIMLRCNPIIMSIAKTTSAANPIILGSDTFFPGWTGSNLTFWTMKFCIDYPKAYSGTALVLADSQTQADANLVYHLSNDLKGIAIDIVTSTMQNVGFAWSASNDYINTTEQSETAKRNTYITKSDIL